MAAAGGLPVLMARPPGSGPASDGTSVHSRQAIPLPLSGSVQTVPSDPAHPQNASDEPTRECVPGPLTSPFTRGQWTGHFTSYKHRTSHELATAATMSD